jgi:flagellar biosynthesis GTPase FlhF
LLKDRIEKIIDYYEASERENVGKFTKPLLRSLLVETETDDSKEIEESISDIINIKSATQTPLSLKLKFRVPTEEEIAGDYTLGKVLKGDKLLHTFSLNDDELSRNVLAVGRIGTGKTTTTMKILSEWL